MNLKIVKPPAEILSKATEVVTDVHTQVLPYISTMRELMKNSQGIALAANQAGVPYRFFIDRKSIYINPTIEVIDSETIQGREGCLSMPGGMWMCERYKEVELTYETTKGKTKVERVRIPEEIKTTLDQSIVAKVLYFQHEVDHLNGTLVSDHGVKTTAPFEDPDGNDDGVEVVDARTLPTLSLAQLQQVFSQQMNDPENKAKQLKPLG